MPDEASNTKGFGKFVLASSSPYRRAQIETQLGLQLTCLKPDVDESALPDEPPEELALRLSLLKAKTVAQRIASTPASESGNRLIIAGDQTASHQGMLLRKPGYRDAAVEQLKQLNGDTVLFHSGLCVLETSANQHQCVSTTTKVTFRQLTDDQIESYIDKEKPYDCVGAFKSEALGVALFEKVESPDPSALIGVPLISLTRILQQFGVDVLNAS